jgi:hypothetical protein
MQLSRIDRFLLGLVAGMLLALGIVFVSHAHSQTIVTGGNRKIFPAYVNPCTLPFYDNFLGDLVLTSCYTVPSPGSFTSVNVVSNQAVANPSGSSGIALMTGVPVASDQTASVSIVFASNPGISGPIVRGSLSGNGYLWAWQSGELAVLIGGTIDHSLGTCPVGASSDVLQLSISGSTLTCTDVTTWATASFSDPDNTYTGGSPGFVIDDTSESTAWLRLFSASAP